tara:strand:- start:5879 stop:6163 length:285 start_codon:yes stop_codon:yes gene_type:complete
MDINILKVVRNNCYGGFSLSEEAYNLLDMPWDGYGYDFNNHRDDPKLVEVVEALGTKASGTSANLVIVEIPDDVEWYIDEYDGWETVREKHRTW